MSNQSNVKRSLTLAEQKALDELVARRKVASPRIKLLGKRGGATAVGTDHSDPTAGFALLMEAVGTKDEAFLAGLMEHLINAGAIGKDVGEAGEAKANFLLSVVKGIEPKDEIEAMLAAQMAAVHEGQLSIGRAMQVNVGSAVRNGGG